MQQLESPPVPFSLSSLSHLFSLFHLTVPRPLLDCPSVLGHAYLGVSRVIKYCISLVFFPFSFHAKVLSRFHAFVSWVFLWALPIHTPPHFVSTPPPPQKVPPTFTPSGTAINFPFVTPAHSGTPTPVTTPPFLTVPPSTTRLLCPSFLTLSTPLRDRLLP